MPPPAALLLGALVLASPSWAQEAPPAPAAPDDPWAFIAARYDADGDGSVARAEYTRGDAGFARLDRDGDGALTPADFARSEPSAEDLALRDGLAARALALFSLQGDGERDVLTRAELQAAVASSDADADGALSRAELAARLDSGAGRRVPGMVAMLLGERDRAELLMSVVDADGDGALAEAEFLAWFDAHDPSATGRWTADELRRAMSAMAPPGGESGRGQGRDQGRGQGRGQGREPGTRGPDEAPRGPRAPDRAAQGAVAPDFTLSPEDGGQPLTLSSFTGDRPVALVFGSYT
jgi:Ca2+-binding EF-hand superfamily protein